MGKLRKEVWGRRLLSPIVRSWELGKCKKGRTFQKEGPALQKCGFTTRLLGECGNGGQLRAAEPRVFGVHRLVRDEGGDVRVSLEHREESGLYPEDNTPELVERYGDRLTLDI